MNNIFYRIARFTSQIAGSPWAFMGACFVIIIWIFSGPWFHFSDTWQLVVNTATTIITFLMVFLLQNSQNRDTKVIQLKLDELIRAVRGARNRLVNLESLSDEELKELEKQFIELREKSTKRASTARAIRHTRVHAGTHSKEGAPLLSQESSREPADPTSLPASLHSPEDLLISSKESSADEGIGSLKE